MTSGLLRSIGRCKRGSAAIEFGLVAPILSVMLLGVLDFGIGYWDQLRVNSAAAAGAAYAVNNGFDSTAIQNAVTAGGPAAMQASPVPSETCGCPSATAGVTAATPSTPPCSGTCPDGTSPGTYVTVNAQMSYTTVFPWPGIARPLVLKGTTVVRIQ